MGPDMGRGARRLLMRYGLAALAVGLALVLNLQTYQAAPVSMALAAVMVAGWFGGPGPALTATALAAVGCELGIFGPSHDGPHDRLRDSLRCAVLVAGGLLVTGLVAALKRAQSQAERQAVLASEHLRRSEASESHFRRLTEANLLGIVTGDPDGTIRDANDAFLDLVGYSRDDLDAGRLRWADLTPPADRRRDARALAELVAEGSCAAFEKEFIRKDGRHIPVLVGGAWHQGWQEYVGFVLDLSERKRTETELRLAKEAAEAAIRAKDRFLAVLSHELRTPLTPVLVAVSALLEGKLDGRLGPTLEMIRRNIEVEAHLIDDLLDVSRMDREGVRIEPRLLDLHDLIRQAVAICRPEIERAGLRMALDLSATSHHVAADPDRLRQLLGNLIQNAVQHTPSGGLVSIRTGNEPAAPSAAGPGSPSRRQRLVAEFTDNGRGLEPEDLARVFEPFEQRPARSRGGGAGLGLGLAIAHALAEAHGGRLTATSAGHGLGSTFRLELDTVAAPPTVEPVLAPADGSGESPRPLRVLLVEDNADTLRYLTLVLRRLGHDVIPAADLATAQSAVTGPEPFDLILSDIELPDGTGLELMRNSVPTGTDPPSRSVASARRKMSA